jgi:hypothetical protein
LIVCGLSERLNDEMVAQAHDELMAVEEALGQIALTKTVLRRAAMPMPTVVKTLDALHLATAILLRESREGSLVFASHDVQQLLAARALGFLVLGSESHTAS